MGENRALPALLRGVWLCMPRVAAACPLLLACTHNTHTTKHARRTTPHTTHEGRRAHLRFAHTRDVQIDGPRCCCLCFLFFRKQSTVQKQRTTHKAGASTHAGRAQSRDTKNGIGLSGVSGVSGGGVRGQGGAGQGRPPLCPPQARKKCVVRCVKGLLAVLFLCLVCAALFCEKKAHTAAQCAVRRQWLRSDIIKQHGWPRSNHEKRREPTGAPPDRAR